MMNLSKISNYLSHTVVIQKGVSFTVDLLSI